MKEETKRILTDVAERAIKTFIQAFFSSISVDLLLGATDFDAFKKIGLSMLVAALAAGISAAWNGAVKTLTQGGEA